MSPFRNSTAEVRERRRQSGHVGKSSSSSRSMAAGAAGGADLGLFCGGPSRNFVRWHCTTRRAPPGPRTCFCVNRARKEVTGNRRTGKKPRGAEKGRFRGRRIRRRRRASQHGRPHGNKPRRRPERRRRRRPVRRARRGITRFRGRRRAKKDALIDDARRTVGGRRSGRRIRRFGRDCHP